MYKLPPNLVFPFVIDFEIQEIFQLSVFDPT